MIQVLEAVNYLHVKNIVKGYVSLQNIIITEDQVKLIDFSKSFKKKEKKLVEYTGEAIYTPPEGCLTCKSDYW